MMGIGAYVSRHLAKGCMEGWSLACKALIAWFAVVVLLFAVLGDWSLVIFAAGFGAVIGGLEYRYRRSIRPLAARLGLNNYAGFLVLSIAISTFEETFCYLTGNHIAYPVLWIDLILVSVMWTVWFGTWYFYLSKRYAFSEKEALLLAGSVGIFYEFVGTGAFLSNPIGIMMITPLAIVIYAAIFVWPMQLIDFSGKNNSWIKYPVSILLPFILTFPVAIVLYVIFSLLHVW